MKVMNEIKAERGGTICAIIAEDGSPVQFGDVLFRIK
jgi:biotin carboxyl carrier protein